MITKPIPEAELLGLLTKTEEEREQVFVKYGLLKSRRVSHVLTQNVTSMEIHAIRNKDINRELFVHETEADLAERLWKKAKSHLTLNILHEVFGGDSYELMINWIRDAEPIHRIVAAIIALQRVGVEI